MSLIKAKFKVCESICTGGAERQFGFHMSIEELSPEELAKVFFHYQELLASDFGCSNGSQPHSWNEISHRERSHMVTAARLALLEIGMSKCHEDLGRDRYFVKPGSAEWGC